MSSKRIRKLSQSQEKKAAEDIGGYTTAGSGAPKATGGGDARKRGDIRVECKFTEKDVFVLRRAELSKIKMQALRGGLEEPVMQIDFVGNGHHELYAVRPSWKQNKELFEETTKGSIRINKFVLAKKLNNNPRGVQVSFIRGQAKSREIYDILPWQQFIEERETEDC